MNKTSTLLVGLLGLILLLIGGELFYIFFSHPSSSTSGVQTPAPTPHSTVQAKSPGEIPIVGGEGFVLLDGTVEKLGAVQTTGDNTAFFVVGRIENVQEEQGSVFAAIRTSDTTQPILFLLYESANPVPFLLNRQKTRDFFPSSDTFTTQSVTSPQALVAKLTSLEHKDAIIRVDTHLSIQPGPTHTPIQQSLEKLLTHYGPCNQQVRQNTTAPLSCTPYSYQINIYAP